MKRILAAFLFLLYFTSTSGATIHLHFCMNELVGMSLSERAEIGAPCRYCGMEKPGMDMCAMRAKDCCKDKKIQIKVDKDQRITHLLYHNDTQIPEVVIFSYIKYTGEPFSGIFKFADDNAPPIVHKQPVFIRNRVFRI